MAPEPAALRGAGPAPREDGKALRILEATLWLSAAVLLRCALSMVGDNFDVRHFYQTAQIMQEGAGPYSKTAYYNYGPLWAWVLQALGAFQRYLGWKGVAPFHLLLAFTLSLVDAASAALLARRYGRALGLAFLFHPVLTVLTGVHSQFDSVAVLFGILACQRLDRGGPGDAGRNAVAAVWLGVSLAFKHVLFLFPVWLFLRERRERRGGWMLLLLPYFLFLGSFLLMAKTYGDWLGVLNHVALYAPFQPGWTGALLDAFLRLVGSRSPWAPFLSERILLVAVLLSAGWFAVRREKGTGLLALYLATLVAFSPEGAFQYLAIPVLACVLSPRHPEIRWYTWSSVVVLALSPLHLGLARWWWTTPQALAVAQTLVWVPQLFLAFYVLRSLRRAPPTI